MPEDRAYKRDKYRLAAKLRAAQRKKSAAERRIDAEVGKVQRGPHGYLPPPTAVGRTEASTRPRSRGETRDERELKRYGFVGASERSNARAKRRRAEETRGRPRAEAVRKGEFKPSTPREQEQQRRSALTAALERSGIFETAKQAHRTYDDRTLQGKALSFAIGPAGEAEPGEKAILAASAFPLFRPIRGAKALVAGAGALRAGLGRSGARAAAESAYKTPTLATAAGKAVRKVAPGAAPKAAVTPLREVTRERTEKEAQARLKKLDAAYESTVAKVSEMFEVDPKLKQLETRLRNRGRGKRAYGKATRATPQRTVNQEIRAKAEDSIAAAAERNPQSREANLLRERQELRAKLTDRGMASIEGRSPSSLGTVTERYATELVPERLEGDMPAGQKVREALGPARARRAAQEGLYREERGKRVAKAEAAGKAAGGGIAGHAAAKAQLRGELPKVKFAHLREGKLSEGDLDELFRNIDEHPDLEFYGRLSARDALREAFLHGRTPQKAQLRLLQTVFGEDGANEIAKVSRLRRAGELTMDAANVPRALMATADLSFPFRQGIVLAHSHPGIFARGFRPMVKAFGSERAHAKIAESIRAHPDFDLAERAGVSFTDLEGVAQREEAFASGLAEKIPVAGRVVRSSGRAYTTAANFYRMELFSRLLKEGKLAGHNTESLKVQRSLANIANTFTGRGTGGQAWEQAAPFLNNMFFSPRLIRARINMLNPVWYARLDPYARKQAVKALVRMVGTSALILGAVKETGAADVSLDPRSADFAKIRLGNTRIDIGGGFQSYIRLIAQLTSGKTVSSTTGKVTKLGPGFGETSKFDKLVDFATGKTAPPASFAVDFFRGTDFAGQPVEWKRAVLGRLTPILAQDILDLYRETGSVPLAAGGYALGVGVQTYGDKSPAAKVKSKHDEYGEKIVEGLKQTGLGDKLTPQLELALEWRQKRYAARERDGVEKGDNRAAFISDISFLHRNDIIDDAQYKQGIRWAKAQRREEVLRREIRKLSGWYFDDLYGDALADVKDKLFDEGYDLPQLR